MKDRDKDYWKLRNMNYGSRKGSYNHKTGKQIPFTKEEMEARDLEYDLWKKYGLKSMVGDKRRRCSTRKANQRHKQLMSQIERSRNKRQVKIYEEE